MIDRTQFRYNPITGSFSRRHLRRRNSGVLIVLAARVLAILLALTALASVAAPQDEKASTHRQPAAESPRDPASNPVSITLVTPPKTAAQAAEEQEEKAEKRALDEKTIELTDKIAKFTMLLFAAAVVRCLVFVLQYMDSAKRIRTTAFGRFLKHSQPRPSPQKIGSFVPLEPKNDGYEYQE